MVRLVEESAGVRGAIDLCDLASRIPRQGHKKIYPLLRELARTAPANTAKRLVLELTRSEYLDRRENVL